MTFEDFQGEKIDDIAQFTGDLTDDKWTQLALAAVMVLQIFTYKQFTFTMQTSFMLAGQSAIANDSIQTIGTFIAATRHVAWQWIWLMFGLVFVATTTQGWVVNDGDISQERLASKGYDYDPTSYTYWQASAPVLLMFITRLRMPVSTSFLLLGLFAQKSSDFIKVLTKSFLGQGISFACTIILQPICQHGFVRRVLQGDDKNVFTMIAEVCCTSFLWSTWLMQDMSNIAIQLKRSLDVWELILALVSITIFLMLLSLFRGEKVQTIVDQKYNTKNLNECALIDFTQGCVLLYFKQRSKIPMSTTWTFLGLLAGRELGIYFTDFTWERIGHALKMMFKELLFACVGLGISIGLLLIQNPNYFG